MADEHHRHEGDFAEGQETREHHPEEEERDFAEGQERHEHEHEGTFGTGQEEREHHPEHKPEGDFARTDEPDEYGRET